MSILIILIAIIYNKYFSNVINSFGMQNKEIYNERTVNNVAKALEYYGHNVEIIDGNMNVIDSLKSFMPKVLDGERMGMVFNMAYGIQGESRYTHIPAMLEMLGIPYVGSNPSGHALALDKVITKVIMQQQNIPTPKFWVYSSHDEDMSNVEYPVIVKPKMESVSFGLKVVDNEQDLKEAVKFIIDEFQQQALVEQFIRGREFAVGVIGNSPTEAFPVLEIDLENNPDAIQFVEDKKHKPRQKICPANLPEKLAVQMQEESIKAFKALQLKDFARIDIRMDENDNFYILEINSMASLGASGSYPFAAKAAGLSYDALVNKMLEVAAKRNFADKYDADETEAAKSISSINRKIKSFLRNKQIRYVQKTYGQKNWQELLEPVIDLAKTGYPISALQERFLNRERNNFEKVDSKSGIKYFFNNSEPYKEGEIFKQPELANLLTKIAEKGINEFYRGNTAKQIDADMRENGGVLRYDDLALIPFPIEREPLNTSFRGLDIFTMPPPGAGTTLLYALNMLEFMDKNYRIQDDNHLYHIMIKIIRKAFLERAERPYDPNFFQQISDNAKMLDHNFAYDSIKEIIEDVNKKLLPIIPSEDEISGETTHLSVIDKSGLAVSLTQSIERVYGSKAAAEGLGFLYNNYLYDFEYNQPEHPYYIRPNANPWATVTPSLIYQNNDIWMSLGSPGSERIVSTLLLFLLRITDRNYSIDKAMKAPRLHCSLGGRVSLEAGRFDSSLIEYLKNQDYRIDAREDYAFYLGCIQAVLKKQTGHGFQAIADVRRDGTAK